MAENNQRRSMTTFFRVVTLFPFAFFVLLVIGVAVFASVYVATENALFFYLLIAFAVIMAIGYILVTFYMSRRFNAIFVRGLYSITIYNLRNITDNENALIDYPNNTYASSIKTAVSSGTSMPIIREILLNLL